MSIDVTGTALEESDTLPYFGHTISMAHCLEGSEGSEYVSPNPETFFALNISIEFDTYHDLTTFLGHPERAEIEHAVINHIQTSGNETFALELDRDRNPVYIDDNGPETFTSGTLGDFHAVLSEIIPTINDQYGLNITRYGVEKDSVQAPNQCIPPYLGPNMFAEVPDSSSNLQIPTNT